MRGARSLAGLMVLVAALLAALRRLPPRSASGVDRLRARRRRCARRAAARGRARRRDARGRNPNGARGCGIPARRRRALLPRAGGRARRQARGRRLRRQRAAGRDRDRAAARAHPPRRQEIRRRETSAATATLAGRTPRDAWRAAFGMASADAAKGLALGFAADAKPLEALIADLASRRGPSARPRHPRPRRSPEPARRSRRCSSGCATVIPRSSTRRSGALAQIGDPRAVRAAHRGRAGRRLRADARASRASWATSAGPRPRATCSPSRRATPTRAVRRAAREALADLSARAEAAARPGFR